MTLFNKLAIENNSMVIDISIENLSFYEDIYLKAINVYTPEEYISNKPCYTKDITVEKYPTADSLKVAIESSFPLIISWYNANNVNNETWTQLKAALPENSVVYKTENKGSAYMNQYRAVFKMPMGNQTVTFKYLPTTEINAWELLTAYATEFGDSSTSTTISGGDWVNHCDYYTIIPGSHAVADRQEELSKYIVKFDKIPSKDIYGLRLISYAGEAYSDSVFAGDSFLAGYPTSDVEAYKEVHITDTDELVFNMDDHEYMLDIKIPTENLATIALVPATSSSNVTLTSSYKEFTNPKEYTDRILRVIEQSLITYPNFSDTDFGDLIDAYRNNSEGHFLTTYRNKYLKLTGKSRYENLKKEDSLILYGTDLIDQDSMKKVPLNTNLFIVEVEATGAPAPDTPCNKDVAKDICVVYDKRLLSRRARAYFGSIEGCTPNRDFIDFILRLKALELAAESCEYLLAEKYWKLLLGDSTNENKKGCGCYD